jgi:tetratricopeptide (TPR) repeat protein
MVFRPFVVSLIAAFFLLPLHLYGQTDAVRQADALIKRGNPQAALDLLLPLEQQNEQNADYHYFVGIAATDAGKIDLAVTHLRRALAHAPDLHQARAELGRAYLLMGDLLAAHFEFERVKRSNPPPEVIANLDRYVERLHETMRAQRKRVIGSVSIGIGYDSNVNSATSAQQISLPILGGIVATLDQNGRSRRDNFATLSGEIAGFHPVSDNWELIGSAGAQGKFNASATNFDYTNISALAGVRYNSGPNQVSLLANYEELGLDYARTRDTTGLSFDVRRVVHPLVEISGFVQAARLTYPQDRLRDADRTVVGLAVIPAAFGRRIPNSPPLGAVYFGEEKPVNAGVSHLGYELRGARIADVHFFTSRLASFAGLSYEHRAYQGADPLFGTVRADRQWDLNLGVYYTLSRNWTLTPTVSHTDNKSNIEPFKYRRTAASVALRYHF